MNGFARWGKFNLVGAMGVMVQLCMLALINRFAAGHYLLASSAAIELTLLHNFVWHLRYTWRDRRETSTVLPRLIQFHVSNGMVSLMGNLALMRILVHEAHFPVLVSNGIAILCCSMLNYWLGEYWTFGVKVSQNEQPAEAALQEQCAAAEVSLVQSTCPIQSGT